MTAVRRTFERDGQIARVRLSRPKGNLLDAEMVAALRDAVAGLASHDALKLLIFDAEGPHFSFGASVAEHLPPHVDGMLARFHGLFREIEDVRAPTMAIVRGQSLGGGFELAIACGRVLCDPSARFGLPEVKLGVFPPIASLLLPFRVRMPDALSIVLSGASLDGEAAADVGIADDCVADPEAAAMDWFEAALAPQSAVAVRLAWRALRRPVAKALGDDLAEIERLYLRDLMERRDPVEGLQAFLERRPPKWEDR